MKEFDKIAQLYGANWSFNYETEYFDVTMLGDAKKTYMPIRRNFTLSLLKDGVEHIFRGESVEEVEAMALEWLFA